MTSYKNCYICNDTNDNKVTLILDNRTGTEVTKLVFQGGHMLVYLLLPLLKGRFPPQHSEAKHNTDASALSGERHFKL